MDYPACPRCSRKLRPIPRAYRTPWAYRLLRWLQGFPEWRDSEFLRAGLEWLVIPGDDAGSPPWALGWCSCDYTESGAEGSNFWRGIYVI